MVIVPVPNVFEYSAVIPSFPKLAPPTISLQKAFPPLTPTFNFIAIEVPRTFNVLSVYVLEFEILKPKFLTIELGDSISSSHSSTTSSFFSKDFRTSSFDFKSKKGEILLIKFVVSFSSADFVKTNLKIIRI